MIPTPDFETYSMDFPLTSATLIDDVVIVEWIDGRRGRFHSIWLRDNDASPQSINAKSRERTFSLVDVPLDIQPRSIGVSPEGGLVAEWHDGLRSHYHPGWLREFDYSNKQRPVDSWETITWGRELEQSMPVFSADAVLNGQDIRYEFLTTLRRSAHW